MNHRWQFATSGEPDAEVALGNRAVGRWRERFALAVERLPQGGGEQLGHAVIGQHGRFDIEQTGAGAADFLGITSAGA